MGFSFRARQIFAYRSPAGGTQDVLPACRAWRIVARQAADFITTQPPIVDGSGLWPPAPTGLLDGAYPVLVRLTNTDGGDRSFVFPVDGDGWNAIETGPNWRIEYVLQAGGATTDRFAYSIETVDDLKEAGQVNSHLVPPIVRSSELLLDTYATSQNLTGKIYFLPTHPTWANALALLVRGQATAWTTSAKYRITHYDFSGVGGVVTNSGDVTIGNPETSAESLIATWGLPQNTLLTQAPPWVYPVLHRGRIRFEWIMGMPAFTVALFARWWSV